MLKTPCAWRWIPGLFLLVLLFTGCSTLSSEVKLTGKDSSANVKTGQIFSVTLEGNPTTGYTWQANEMDEKLLGKEGEIEFKADSSLVGAGGLLTLKFKALAPGKTTLHLVYRRSWEKDIPPLKTYDLDVTIQ